MTAEPPLPAGKVGDGRGRLFRRGELRSEWTGGSRYSVASFCVVEERIHQKL